MREVASHSGKYEEFENEGENPSATLRAGEDEFPKQACGRRIR